MSWIPKTHHNFEKSLKQKKEEEAIYDLKFVIEKKIVVNYDLNSLRIAFS